MDCGKGTQIRERENQSKRDDKTNSAVKETQTR